VQEYAEPAIEAPRIQSKSADVLSIFFASFGRTQTLEEARTELIEAKNTALLLASAPASALVGG
jgi:hypothetical protein